MTKQNRRAFLRTLGFGAGSLAFPGLLNITCTSKKNPPNILFIFTDDQRFDTIHAINNPGIITPNMDRLVKDGVSFTRAHFMGGTSAAVCMPSRAMLLTGKSLFHLEDNGGIITEDHALMPEVFKKAGYKTYGIGKWHNDQTAYNRCFTNGGKIMFKGMSNHLNVPVFDYDPTGNYSEDKKYIGSKFSSELFSDEAIKHIENHNFDDPMFMYLSYTAPHDPRMAPKEYLDLYPLDEITLPSNFMPEHPFDNGEMKIRDETLAPWPRTPEIVREHIAAYYAMITHLDFHIGKVLEALDRSGQRENTIIVFAGDNGLAVGQHGLLGKQNLYDHSVRVPLIFAGPGIPKGVQAHTLCYLLDIFPTLCEITEQSIPESVEGRSLLPAIKNTQTKCYESVFLAYKYLQRAIRTDDNWKLIKYNVQGHETTQLFNLNDDPGEMKNLVDNAEHAEILGSLINMLKQHIDKYDDICDLDAPDWGIQE